MKTTNKPFTTIEEVNDYLSGDKIKCLLCDKWYVGLGVHIVKKHKMELRGYKVRFNIPLTRDGIKNLVYLKPEQYIYAKYKGIISTS